MTAMILMAMAAAADPAPVVPDPLPVEQRVYALERRVELLERLAGVKPPTTPAAPAAAPTVLATSAPDLPASVTPTYPPPDGGGPWAWDGRSAWVGPAAPMSLVADGRTTTPDAVVVRSGPTNPDGSWVTPRQYQQYQAGPPAGPCANGQCRPAPARGLRTFWR